MPVKPASTEKRIWVISDGRRGIENQALGLAESMAYMRAANITTHHIDNTGLFKALPPTMQKSLRGRPDGYGLTGDMPDIAIGCGRQAIAPLLAIKSVAPSCFTTYVQDPRIDPALFDLVIAPEHDGLSGANVETMIGSPNRITATQLDEAKTQFAAQLSALPAPRAAFLIGGKSKTHNMNQAGFDTHMQAAQALLDEGHSLMISTSRRTPEFARRAWTDFAKDKPTLWLYDSAAEPSAANPYFAFLGAADMILATQDSTNMLLEACATGKPVFTLSMQGQDRKFAKLYAALETRCGVVPWAGQTSGAAYPPLNETARMAALAWQHFDAKN